MQRLWLVYLNAWLILYHLWERGRLVAVRVGDVALAPITRLRGRGTTHDRHWRAHPAVPTGDQLTFGQRAADMMKAAFATWSALFGIIAFIFLWLGTSGFGRDPFPYILLNLCLSCLAALQCFILLIAAKRADQIAALIALHTLQNTEALKAQGETLWQLVVQNTALTEQNAQMAAQLHEQAVQHAQDMAMLHSQVSNNTTALAALLQQVMVLVSFHAATQGLTAAEFTRATAAAQTVVAAAKDKAPAARKPRAPKQASAADQPQQEATG